MACALRILALAAAMLLSACLATMPAPAYGWFNDVTDDYPASQPLSVSGDVLTGAQVPEGTYAITASSSSYMCKLSDVTLTSAGGNLYATFTISKAYNALYLGTAEKAAASTNAAGDDASAYYIAEPFEGYVERQFTIPIAALNKEMTLATFNGGSKGLEDGVWYTRTVAFNSSAAVENAIAEAAGGGSSESQSGDSGSSGGQSEVDAGTEQNESTETGTSESGSDSATEGGNSNKGNAGAPTGKRGERTAGGQAFRAGTSADASRESNQPSDAKSDEGRAAGSQERVIKKAHTKVGRAISFVGQDVAASADLVTMSGEAAASEEQESLPSSLIAGCIVAANVVLAAVCAIVALRVRPGRRGTG